ncbi:hypothetical protein GPALN_009722 [Globodera pallida]|nr:hypothetical protein GPALN_009722 [Globodera pallida]
MSISTKSSNNGHRTAAVDQQEHLSFAHLDESEEQLQMLRHKIADLERQQSMNSPTSSDGFDLVAQNENELEDADGTLGDRNEFEEAKNHEEKEAKIAAAEFAVALCLTPKIKKKIILFPLLEPPSLIKCPFEGVEK